MARKLGINTIHIHRHAGILSACGMELAPQVATREEAATGILNAAHQIQCARRLQELETQTRRDLEQRGFTPEQLQSSHYLQLRYRGTDQGILICSPADSDYTAAFHATYKREFGFNLDRPIEVDHLRVRTSATPLPSQKPGSIQPLLPKRGAPRMFILVAPGSPPRCTISVPWAVPVSRAPP